VIRSKNTMNKRSDARAFLVGAAALAGATFLSGCHVDMWIQPKTKALYESDFFSDRQASRPLVPGTVSQNGSRLDDPAYYTAYGADRKLVRNIPARAVKSFPSPKAMLLKGREQYNVYCSPCHGATGNGNGMITQRGLGYWQKLPASYHTDRLRKIEDGHFYDVIVNGYGVMYGYASRIQNVNDRWAIVAYVRALQLSQRGVPEASLTAEQREALRENAATNTPEGNQPELQGEPGAVTQPTVPSGTEGVERPVNRTPGGVAPGARNRAAEPASGSATSVPPGPAAGANGGGANGTQNGSGGTAPGAGTN
jgi:mono/diheme cytochrome c family protein